MLAKEERGNEATLGLQREERYGTDANWHISYWTR